MSEVVNRSNRLDFVYPPALSSLITEAVSRLKTEMELATPFMAGQVLPWLHGLAGEDPPEAYFKHPLAFPSLLLPWWLEESLHGGPDISFQAGLVYSTLNGYYYIRLIDNLMDNQATVELKLLPALNFFHTQFQRSYQPYFASKHPFWESFTRTWFHSAEVTMQDAHLAGLDELQFKQTAAQKTSAAKIPLAAVCYRYNQPEQLSSWAHLVELFGCWHQFLNDLFDWHKDSTRQLPTYFLSEAERRRGTETLMSWVTREGFSWGIEKLQGWMVDLKRLALDLHSPALLDYLDFRERLLLKQHAEVAAGFDSLAKILNRAKE